MCAASTCYVADMKTHFSLILCLLLALSAASCVTEDVERNTRAGNFDALWRTLDERYCFFVEKGEAYGLDWNEVYARYRPAVTEQMNAYQLFDVMGRMLAELRDGHVNLYAPHDVARYGAWFDDFPANFNDSLARRYLGRTEDYRTTAGMQYRVLDDHTGYLRVSTFEYPIGDGNLHEVMAYLGTCQRLIVDVRSNGGGLLTAAEKLASAFINEPLTGGYMCHKTGPAHTAFSQREPISIEPFVGLRWQKPVYVLTNRRTYSAANSFVMFLKGLPHVTVVGDRTGGGAGMPLHYELPNGWSVRFSACPMFDREGRLTEMGIDPDLHVDLSEADVARGIDTLIEAARHQP